AATGVNIINSNALSLSGTNLTSTVNGVASAALDITPAITSKVWCLTCSCGSSPVTNFIGTTDAIDFFAKTSGTERMRVLSTGYRSEESRVGKDARDRKVTQR